MLKVEFLNDQNTRAFTDWFAGLLSEQRSLDFMHVDGVYASLHDAFADYAWPNKRTDIPTPEGTFTLTAWSDFAANERVLDQLSLGVRHSLTEAEGGPTQLADWVKAVMVWGGVYTRHKNGGGNAGWLETMGPHLAAYLRQALIALKQGTDDMKPEISDLRSNAGTTKVHSLLLPEFIIYDSRVAAALAWLVLRWSREAATVVPAHLRFECMRANGGNKCRTPDGKVFRYFAASGQTAHYKHAMWNIRASWLLAAVLNKAKLDRPTLAWRPRELEAALFMLGNDLTVALGR